MWRAPLERALEQQPAVAEGVLRLRARRVERGGELALARDPPHAASAAAGRRLDHQRKADRLGGRDQRGVALVAGSAPGMVGTPAVARDALRLGLVAHLADDGRRRPDPGQPGIDHGLREIRVLGEEAVARMHRVGAGCASPPSMIAAMLR